VRIKLLSEKSWFASSDGRRKVSNNDQLRYKVFVLFSNHVVFFYLYESRPNVKVVGDDTWDKGHGKEILRFQPATSNNRVIPVRSSYRRHSPKSRVVSLKSVGFIPTFLFGFKKVRFFLQTPWTSELLGRYLQWLEICI
jgi:hypothetical protein